ncbi:MAG: tyrosine-type recombinase/integrase [Planctomycetaceae bacterium]|jgi:integrase|nr:tyrosine-type recombinase/integrase [Planctomycetaceae bacterium]
MKISQFFEQEYVPTYLTDDVVETIKCYRTSIKKLKELCDDPTIYEVNLYGTDFVRKLRNEGLQNVTIAKHCRHLNSIFLKLGPPGYRNRDAKGLLTYIPYFKLPKVKLSPPRVFEDENFQSLFNAFGCEKDYPRYLLPEKRPLFWQAIMIFVSIVAVRREVVLGIEWRDINREELFVHVRPEIDKKDQNRYKPIKSELIEYLELIRPSHINWNSNSKIFQWTHGDKCWYKCWHKAEERAGIKMGLHDLKRFSGDLAIRAGASDLELMQHMDHTNISTTLKHYCRPKTRNIVNKIVVPIPNTNTVTPPPSSPTPTPEPQHLPLVHIAPAFQFNSQNEIVQFYLKETQRIENSEIAVRTPSGTILTIVKSEEDISNDNTNNLSCNGNNAG